MSGVPLKPVPLNCVFKNQSVEGDPQLLIFYRLFVSGLPSVLFPVVDPLGDPLPQVLRISVEIHNARFLERSKSLNRRLKLHLVVGSGGVPTGDLFILALKSQDRAPSSRSWISGARSVGVDLNSFCR